MKKVKKDEKSPYNMNSDIADLKKVNQSNIESIINQIKINLKDFYLYPEKVNKFYEALDTDFSAGLYAESSTPKTLTEQLTTTLHKVVKDKHLRIQLPSETHRSPKSIRPLKGINKVEIIDGNIGYIEIDSFRFMFESENRIIGAMEFVKKTKALILDLRKCRGGSGDSTNFLLSYFFDKGTTLLLKSYFRPSDHEIQVWSSWTPYKYVNPVYVLTSNFTFSAGEHFAFAFKIHERATLVGENTGGGAHPVTINYYEPGIAITVPIGRTFDPITEKDWEGTGVEPDVECGEENSLKKAISLIEAIDDSKVVKEVEEKVKVVRIPHS